VGVSDEVFGRKRTAVPLLWV